MNKSKEFLKSKKFKLAMLFVVSALAIIFCILGEGIIKNNNSSQFFKSSEIKELTPKDNLIADTVVQTGTVTVHYVDENGNQIPGHENTVKTGNVGEFYDVTRPSITGYVAFGDEPLTRAGRYDVGNIDVYFKYKTAVSEVYTKVDKKGQNGAEENQINVAFNNTKKARDYGVKIITKDNNGNVINGGEFKISKGNNIVKEGKVRDGELYVGKIGVSKEGRETYTVEQTKATVGYKKLDNSFPVGYTANWNNEQKKFEITLDGNTQNGVNITINESDEIVIEVINPKYANMYEVEVINKSKTQLLTGGKFKVEKNKQVIKEDFTNNGILNIGAFEVSDDGVDEYKIYELITPEGYSPVFKDGNFGIVNIKRTFNRQTNSYDFTEEHNNVEGFSVESNGNGKFTIYIINKEGNDYDLAVKKFISKIDDIETPNREPKVEIVEEKEENSDKLVKKIKYVQDDKIEKAANEQIVNYTIRTYNESNEKGKGKRIIEDIPDGLVYLPDNEINKQFGWKTYKQDKDGDLIETDVISEVTAVATDILVDKEIEGFDINNDEEPKYEDVKVVFQVDEKKVTSKDRIVENVVVLDGGNKTTGTAGGNEVNEDNNKTTEKIYIKYFDLDVTKFIKEVTVKTGSKETRQEIGESQKGKLVKIDVAKKDVANTTIRVTYGLRVKNIGEIEGYATELVDYIPEDFKLVTDGKWEVKKDKAVTKKLENTLLKPGESTVIEITFDWKLTEDNIGRRINEGKITKYANKYNAKDPTEDNNDKEEMLVQIRTGSTWVFIVVAVLVGLWMIVGIVYIIGRNK